MVVAVVAAVMHRLGWADLKVRPYEGGEHSRKGGHRDLALYVALNESGGMPMMKGWFYPGDREGYEFVYPADQARTIARLESVEIPVAPRG